MQIKDLYVHKYGYYAYQADQEVEKLHNKTVYELLVMKKELAEREHDQDVSCLHWFRDDGRFDDR